MGRVHTRLNDASLVLLSLVENEYDVDGYLSTHVTKEPDLNA
jgi:hypothetical protein